MKAAIYFGPQDIRCTTVPDAVLRDDHAMLVQVIATSICGSDLHLYRGALDPIMARGQSQTGHELVGRVLQVGRRVGRFQPGDRISMGYSVSCGHCVRCEVGQTAHCETTQKAIYGFGVPFGNLNGTHAEALVVPHADTHAIHVPESVDDTAAVTLSCNLPSAIIANRLADIRPGERVAVVGCGPTGMMALDLALARGPGRLVALDLQRHRLDLARSRGAVAIDVSEAGWKECALQETGGHGFDKVIEVVGTPDALQSSLDLVRPGGTIAAIGVFTDATFNLNLADVFLRNITLHMNGFASVQPYLQEAVRLIERGVIDPGACFTHTFALANIDEAFSTFHHKRDGAMKVLVRP